MLQSGAVDVHAHLTPASFPENTAHEPLWPCMHRRSAIDATILIADRPFRTLDNRSWEIDRRLQDMDRDGVAVQVLSPMPELLSYWFSGAAADLLCDFINADLATQIARAPTRFAGLGAIPMQDVSLALEHLRRVRTVYGLSGIEIGSNINGVALGDPRFDPIFEAAQDLDLAVFVHALHPIATRESPAPFFAPLIGFPIDTAMAAASILMADTLQRYPRLRIGFSHGGGALAPIVHRLDFAWSSGKIPEGGPRGRPADMSAKMFFDSNVYSPEYLRHIVAHLAPRHVFLGTDYPYAIMQTDPLGFARAAGLDPAAEEFLRWRAAYAFLGIA